MTIVSFLSLYPEKATRVMYEIESLSKAGYEIHMRKPFINSTPLRPLSLLMRYITLFFQSLLSDGDIIHFTNIPDFPALGVLLKRKKFVYDVRTAFATNMYYYTKSRIIWKLAIAIEGLLCRRADVTITANRYLAKRAMKLGAKKVFVVPNYPKSKMSIDISADKVREMYQTSMEDKVFLIVSNLTRLKPFETLFNEFKKVLEVHPDSRLWIVGDGTDKRRLQRIAKRISKKIMFLGYKQISELGSIINASDVCLAIYHKADPRFHRFFANESVWKTSEYALFNKPIVALHMVEEDGLIAATEEDLADKMIEALSDNPPLLEKKTWEDSEKILLEVYRTLEA